ncbi:MAG: imidazole glycerol phosphate synthase subunit HisH [Alphaproteobacteria bacterium]|nr:imidazole glycerol phosphate synthase subunit HisH [Alphaproteobacteria bacterium]
MTVVIVDAGSGNLRSARQALVRVAAEAAAGQSGPTPSIIVSSDPDDVRRADQVVVPGQGAFAECRQGIDSIPGMAGALTEFVASGRPFLGICVGMQLMADRGLEHGVHTGFGWIPGEVDALRPTDPRLKIPHMGWNELHIGEAARAHPVLQGVSPGDHAYFVHSFAFRCAMPSDCLATTDYGGPVTAIIGRANVIGTQFHPEKSQATGLRLLAGFLAWRP